MKTEKKSVSIIGCGWLGYPLAKGLLAHDWIVKGTTTRKEKIPLLQAVGIEAFEVQFPASASLDERLLQSDYLVLNFPPGRRDKNQLAFYAQSIQQIVDRALSINAIKKVIFISSTSVYGAECDVIDESTPCLPESESGKEILKSESMISLSNLPFIVLRFGGLAGPSRHPGRFLSGKTQLANGHQSVNFLHLSDALRIIKMMLENDIKNEYFNVVAPFHPNKKEFYTKMAKMINEAPPIFSDSATGRRKEVQVHKLLNALDYKFIYPDPMHFKFSIDE